VAEAPNKSNQEKTMAEVREHHIEQLFRAELQFRLASAVRLAVTCKHQPLDLPMEWTHGDHRVMYEEIALRDDQAEFAAFFLHRATTYLMAVAVNDAIKADKSNTVAPPNPNTQAAFQIARLIRNAFAHAPFTPTWMIEREYRNQTFAVPGVIELKTSGLNGAPFDWRHYGGPLALLRLCRFVRIEILVTLQPSEAGFGAGSGGSWL
jgi:hypothetical protein